MPVARKMLLQLAVRDIGQLTDIEPNGRRSSAAAGHGVSAQQTAGPLSGPAVA
jgi:hypothetical protein